jgi:hypothetical protein
VTFFAAPGPPEQADRTKANAAKQTKIAFFILFLLEKFGKFYTPFPNLSNFFLIFFSKGCQRALTFFLLCGKSRSPVCGSRAGRGL